MDAKLYVGNLSYDTTEDGLRAKFTEAGTGVSVDVIKDRDTGRSRGFGFVEMENATDAKNAISALNNSELKGRNIVVNEAKPRN